VCWLVDSRALGVCKSFCVTWDNVCGRVGCQTLQAKYKRFEMLKTLLNLKQRYIENGKYFISLHNNVGQNCFDFLFKVAN